MHAQVVAAVASATGNTGAAFITPFNCQASLLRPFATDLQSGEASTVHKFQGGESDVVVFDCVDAAGSNFKLHNWFAHGEAGSDGARLINVAASRAREQLVVLADFGRIHRERRTVDATYRFMRKFLDEAEHVNWRNVLAKPSSPTTVRTDIAQLMIDIENAAGPIEIRSTAIGTQTLTPLLQALRTAASRVPVSIWFSPEPNGDLPVPLTHLTKSDVYLRPARPMPESMAVVGSVVWTSSQPILSDAANVWLRTDHSGFADAARMVVRRRATSTAQGSDQAAERCACGRPLVRVEEFQRMPEMECFYCEPDRTARNRRVRVSG